MTRQHGELREASGLVESSERQEPELLGFGREPTHLFFYVEDGA
jgi:hypothetical protein